LAGPILLIGLGVLLLLSNLGLISGSIWNILLRMWPVVLIVVGIDLLVGRRSVWGSILMIVVILAVLAGGYWIAQVAVPSAGPASTESVTVPRTQAAQIEIGLHGSAGLMAVHAGQASGPLLQASVPLLQGESLRRDVQAEGPAARIDLRTEGVVVFPNISARDQGWDVAIAPGTPLTLRLDLGAGEIRVAGAMLSLQDLRVNLGVGKTEVELGPSVRTIEVSSGIGETTVVLPAGVAARVRVSVAIGDSDVPAGYVRDGEWYVSPGYNSASTHVEVRVNLAIGAIHIRQAP
jgi:hypothetical protein